MMLMINSLLVNLSTGIGMGFSCLMKNEKGRLYLSGDWIINKQLYSVVKGKGLFYLVELGCLLSGFSLSIAAVIVFGKTHIVIFIFGNIGALISGYLYTSVTYKKLFEWQIIRSKVYAN